MLRRSQWVALVLTALAASPLVAGPPADEAPPRGVATVRYDTGSPDGFNGGKPGPVVGNLFNTQSGDPLASGTIYSISAVMNSGGYYGGRFAVAGPILGGSAAFLASPTFPPDSMGSVARAVFPPLSVPGSFLVGFPANLAQGLGIDNDTTQGQGFHGRYWSGGIGGFPAVNIRTLDSQNALLRVRGNVALVPVELMRFDVD